MSIENTYGLTEYNSFFEIPIYRLSNDEFVSELKREIDKNIFFSKEDFEQSFPGEGEKRYERQRRELECIRGYKWKFNEIIGWLTLNKSDNSIAGEVFLKNSIRITKKK